MAFAQNKLLKDHSFNTMAEYFDYIITSKSNGQNKQVSSLFKKLNKENRKEFLSLLADLHHEDTRIYYDTLKYCIELIY